MPRESIEKMFWEKFKRGKKEEEKISKKEEPKKEREEIKKTPERKKERKQEKEKREKKLDELEKRIEWLKGYIEENEELKGVLEPFFDSLDKDLNKLSKFRMIGKKKIARSIEERISVFETKGVKRSIMISNKIDGIKRRLAKEERIDFDKIEKEFNSLEKQIPKKITSKLENIKGIPPTFRQLDRFVKDHIGNLKEAIEPIKNIYSTVNRLEELEAEVKSVLKIGAIDSQKIREDVEVILSLMDERMKELKDFPEISQRLNLRKDQKIQEIDKMVKELEKEGRVFVRAELPAPVKKNILLIIDYLLANPQKMKEMKLDRNPLEKSKKIAEGVVKRIYDEARYDSLLLGQAEEWKEKEERRKEEEVREKRERRLKASLRKFIREFFKTYGRRPSDREIISAAQFRLYYSEEEILKCIPESIKEEIKKIEEKKPVEVRGVKEIKTEEEKIKEIKLKFGKELIEDLEGREPTIKKLIIYNKKQMERYRNFILKPVEKMYWDNRKLIDDNYDTHKDEFDVPEKGKHLYIPKIVCKVASLVIRWRDPESGLPMWGSYLEDQNTFVTLRERDIHNKRSLKIIDCFRPVKRAGYVETILRFVKKNRRELGKDFGTIAKLEKKKFEVVK